MVFKQNMFTLITDRSVRQRKRCMPGQGQRTCSYSLLDTCIVDSFTSVRILAICLKNQGRRTMGILWKAEYL